MCRTWRHQVFIWMITILALASNLSETMASASGIFNVSQISRGSRGGRSRGDRGRGDRSRGDRGGRRGGRGSRGGRGGRGKSKNDQTQSSWGYSVPGDDDEWGA